MFSAHDRNWQLSEDRTQGKPEGESLAGEYTVCPGSDNGLGEHPGGLGTALDQPSKDPFLM